LATAEVQLVNWKKWVQGSPDPAESGSVSSYMLYAIFSDVTVKETFNNEGHLLMSFPF